MNEMLRELEAQLAKPVCSLCGRPAVLAGCSGGLVDGIYNFAVDPICQQAARQMEAALKPAPTVRRQVLDQAIAAVADRPDQYGPPIDNFSRIARRWRTHILNRFDVDVPIDATSVAMLCADLKLARLEGNPSHRDSWVDVAGYGACGAEVVGSRPSGADLSKG